jgi:hypothetical protein
MFRTINVKTVQLSDCRRVVLFHFNKEDGTVQMRHYAIRANPVGISRNIKKIVQSKLPNLGELEDISQFVDGTAGFTGSISDSEAEDEGIGSFDVIRYHRFVTLYTTYNPYIRKADIKPEKVTYKIISKDEKE